MVKRVNPVPSVPATPAKQNPNPTDNTSKRPAEQGFQSILDKYTKDKPDNYKKGGRVKRYNNGGISLEEKYPEAKITRVPPNEPPGKSEKFKEIEADYKKVMPQTSGSRVTEPKFTDSGDTQNLKKVGRGRISGGGGGAAPIPKAGKYEMLKFKKGGTASARADGIAKRGRTRA